MIAVNNIEKSFGKTAVLKGISAEFEQGNQLDHWAKWLWENSFPQVYFRASSRNRWRNYLQ